jgi:hypothetical protein
MVPTLFSFTKMLSPEIPSFSRYSGRPLLISCQVSPPSVDLNTDLAAAALFDLASGEQEKPMARITKAMKKHFIVIK